MTVVGERKNGSTGERSEMWKEYRLAETNWMIADKLLKLIASISRQILKHSWYVGVRNHATSTVTLITSKWTVQDENNHLCIPTYDWMAINRSVCQPVSQSLPFLLLADEAKTRVFVSCSNRVTGARKKRIQELQRKKHAIMY